MAGNFGYGTALKLGSTEIANLTSISGPSYEAETIDVTAHDSADDYFRDFIAGLRDAGEVSFEGNFDPDGATHKSASGGVLYELEQGTAGSWSIVWPDTTTVAFTGIVTSFEPDAPFDDKLGFSATIKISGKPTWTYS